MKKKNHSVLWGIGVICFILAVVLGVSIFRFAFRLTYKDSVENYTKQFIEENRKASEKEDKTDIENVENLDEQWCNVYESIASKLVMNDLNLLTDDEEESDKITSMFQELAEHAGYSVTDSEGELYFNAPDSTAFIVVEDMNPSRSYLDRNVKWFGGYGGESLDSSFYPDDFPCHVGDSVDDVLDAVGITDEMIEYLSDRGGYISFDKGDYNYYISVYTKEKRNEIDFYMAKDHHTISLDFEKGRLDVMTAWYFD